MRNGNVHTWIMKEPFLLHWEQRRQQHTFITSRIQRYNDKLRIFVLLFLIPISFRVVGGYSTIIEMYSHGTDIHTLTVASIIHATLNMHINIHSACSGWRDEMKREEREEEKSSSIFLFQSTKKREREILPRFPFSPLSSRLYSKWISFTVGNVLNYSWSRLVGCVYHSQWHIWMCEMLRD
jgi:hypothetical protein